MIDHIKLHVADPAASRAFYEGALEPLGYRVLLDFGPIVGMGKDRPDFWLAPADEPHPTAHVAFRADSEAEVQRFHAAGLLAGGVDNGEPGLRPHYHQNYYGAFVLDPDGNNVEAVYHGAMQPDEA
jgi:catechol 2,3-dioxygenase-like lactoylglutathione lyase family enzyme